MLIRWAQKSYVWDKILVFGSPASWLHSYCEWHLASLEHSLRSNNNVLLHLHVQFLWRPRQLLKAVCVVEFKHDWNIYIFPFSTRGLSQLQSVLFYSIETGKTEKFSTASALHHVVEASCYVDDETWSCWAYGPKLSRFVGYILCYNKFNNSRSYLLSKHS